MTATTEQARNEMCALVKAVLDANVAGKRVDWPGVENNNPPPADDSWMRVTLRHDPNAQGQRGVGGATGKRRWHREGILTVQFFVPFKAGGLNRAMELACILRDALQGAKTASGVWFKGAEAHEVGSDGNWYNANASARFIYDEVK